MMRNVRRPIPLIAVLLIPLVANAAEAPKPLKVFILAGQSNMEGQAVADLDGPDYNDGRGTLNSLLRDPAKAPLVEHLRASPTEWAVREDVWVRYKREQGPLLAGPLTVGFTVYGDAHHFGPELQFGNLLGDYFDNRVLLIKTAWGGKSLVEDFRPPSSGGEVGPYYTKMIAEIREALDHLKTDFPAYDEAGYELAGCVWYQGWNDGVDPINAVPEYEQNLVNLIQDVRQELDAPHLPFVVGELTGPWVEAPDAWAALRQAQANAAARPEFRGSVLFVETHDFVRPPEESPNPGHGHHEFGNAETCFLVGNALGRGMVTLLAPPADRERDAAPLPASRTVREIEGWTVRVDDRLLQPPEDALGRRALRFLEAKLVEVQAVVPAERLADLRKVTIAGWLEANGYSADLVKCVHLPRAADVATRRNINEQPWVILHELAHGYHDQFLGFDEPRIVAAHDQFKQSGRGDAALLYNGQRVRHYGLTDHKEFFAEMTEAYFGSNDFFPFNRAELQEVEPRLFQLLTEIWSSEVR